MDELSNGQSAFDDYHGTLRAVTDWIRAALRRGLIHLLLIAAVVIFLFNLFTGRRTTV
jgi:hypothetical protein